MATRNFTFFAQDATMDEFLEVTEQMDSEEVQELFFDAFRKLDELVEEYEVESGDDGEMRKEVFEFEEVFVDWVRKTTNYHELYNEAVFEMMRADRHELVARYVVENA